MKKMCQIMSTRCLVLGVVSFFLVFGVGCKSTKPQQYQVTLLPGEGINGVSVEVDLIGIQSADKSEWEGLSVSQYWSDAAGRRRSVDKVTFQLDPGNSLVLPQDHPIWEKWKARNVSYLVVLADLPGIQASGGFDPRRKIVSLLKGSYDVGKEGLTLKVQRTSIEVMNKEKL